MNKLIAILFVIILFGCYNQKKAQQQFSKAAVNYPAIPANYCAVTFPPSTKFIKGDSVITIDTLFQDGLELFDTLITMDTVFIRETITLPPKVITKTIHTTDTVQVENTAKLQACDLERNLTLTLLSDSQKKLAIAEGKANKRGWIMWSLIALILTIIGVGIYIKSKKIKI